MKQSNGLFCKPRGHTMSIVSPKPVERLRISNKPTDKQLVSLSPLDCFNAAVTGAMQCQYQIGQRINELCQGSKKVKTAELRELAQALYHSSHAVLAVTSSLSHTMFAPTGAGAGGDAAPAPVVPPLTNAMGIASAPEIGSR